MFDSNQKSTGTGYTATVALLIVGLIFIPALLLVSRSYGHIALSLAIASSVACMTFAWISWSRFSQLSIPSIVAPEARAK